MSREIRFIGIILCIHSYRGILPIKKEQMAFYGRQARCNANKFIRMNFNKDQIIIKESSFLKTTGYEIWTINYDFSQA